jgi:hypothetical protein
VGIYGARTRPKDLYLTKLKIYVIIWGIYIIKKKKPIYGISITAYGAAIVSEKIAYDPGPGKFEF